MREKPYLGLASFPVLFSIVFASAPNAPEAPQEEMRSVQSGVFTAEQAERGAQVFEDACRNCHDLAQFADGIYLDSWSGKSAQDFIEQIRETMPEDSPGSLQRKEYVDVVTFFFMQNGLPAGDAEMDLAGAKNIRIEGPFKAPDPDGR